MPKLRILEIKEIGTLYALVIYESGSLRQDGRDFELQEVTNDSVLDMVSGIERWRVQGEDPIRFKDEPPF